MKQKQNFIDKYYLHSFIAGIAMIFFYLLSINTSFLYTSIFNYSNLSSDPFDGAINPVKYSLNYLLIKQVDRNKTFTQLDSSMFVKVPTYNADILGRDVSALKSGNKDYEETMFQRVVYITPYMGNYNHDGKENVGSHLAVDIKAPIGTPVYSIANGVVTKVGFEKGGFGNYIVIRHDDVKLTDGSIETIYSSYSHLDTVTIKEGEKTSRGDPIGTVGETGLAVGSHLHFQIDLADAPYHPYWPFTGADQRARGLDFFSAISTGLGRENAMKYTINPMNFINASYNEASISSTEDDLVIIPDEENDLIKDENDVAIADNNIEILKTEEVKIDDKTSEEEIQTTIESDLKIEDTATISKLEIENELDLLTNPLLSYVENKTNLAVLKNSIFSDIDNQNKYYESIKYFKDRGLIAGYEDNNFYPENSITRLESLKILLNSYSHNIIKGKLSKFLDIEDDFWGNWYVSKALDLDLLSLDNTSFYPNRTINRVEVLKLITKLSDIDLSTYAAKNYEIKDVLKTEWEYPYVVFALDNNLFSLNDGSFHTSQTVSRGELVDLMYKFKK